MMFFARKSYDLPVKTMIGYYSIPQIDGKVNHHQNFHLFGDDYKPILKTMACFLSTFPSARTKLLSTQGLAGFHWNIPGNRGVHWHPKSLVILAAMVSHGSLDSPWLSQLDVVIWYRKSWVFSRFFLDLPFKSGMVKPATWNQKSKSLGICGDHKAPCLCLKTNKAWNHQPDCYSDDCLEKMDDTWDNSNDSDIGINWLP